ncbi:hypothetical protein A6S26_34415 [Nostoc sp. ATCC 43529]|nr:hypothetical protein A6S26_34415 [Nostoc sp. ATCC 43529]
MASVADDRIFAVLKLKYLALSGFLDRIRAIAKNLNHAGSKSNVMIVNALIELESNFNSINRLSRAVKNH